MASSRLANRVFLLRNCSLLYVTGGAQQRAAFSSVVCTQKRFNTTQTTVKVEPLKQQQQQPPKQSSPFKTFIKYTGGLVLLVGGVIAYYAMPMYKAFKDDVAHTDAEALKYKPGVIKNVTKRIDRGVENPGGVKLTLYQYVTCPFCCKVRAYLDYYGYNYDIVEVNSISHKELRWSEYKRVPSLAVQEPVSCDLKTKQMIYDDNITQLNDSSVIISALETYRLNPTLPIKKILEYYPGLESKDERGKTYYDFPNKYFVMSPDGRAFSTQQVNNAKDERQWREWVDKDFIHVISPNVYRTLREAIDTFQWFDKVGNWETVFNPVERYAAQYIGALAMYAISTKLKEKYALKDNVRESLYDYGNQWVEAVGSQNKFRGGTTPNLADLALYGALRSFKGTQSFQDLMKHTKLRDWYENIHKQVKLNKGKDKLNLYASSKPAAAAAKTTTADKPKKRFYFF